MVNIHKLSRQLRREIKANPKKACFLGLMLAIAIYAWAPLVIRALRDDSAKTTIAVGTTPNPASPTAPPPWTTAGGEGAAKTTAKPAEAHPQGWAQIAAALEQCPWSKPVAMLALDRDPFQRAKTEMAQELPRTPKPAAPDVTPASLSLALSGTILGTGRQVARINGKTYARGDEVAAKGKDGTPFTFVLTEIEARRVVLERSGKQFELKLSAPVPSGKIELLGSMH